MARMLEEHLDYQIEDLPTPFYCVSCNLDTGSTNVHETGYLPDALRASAALPGIIPPAVVNQRLTIDGAVVNNLPVDEMRLKPVSRIIAVDLSSAEEVNRGLQHRAVSLGGIPRPLPAVRAQAPGAQPVQHHAQGYPAGHAGTGQRTGQESRYPAESPGTEIRHDRSQIVRKNRPGRLRRMPRPNWPPGWKNTPNSNKDPVNHAIQNFPVFPVVPVTGRLFRFGPTAQPLFRSSSAQPERANFDILIRNGMVYTAMAARPCRPMSPSAATGLLRLAR